MLALGTDDPQETPHEPYRLRPDAADLVLQVSIGGTWRSLYRFDPEQANHPVDYEMANFFVSHHPESHFVTGLTAARIDPDRRHALGGPRHTVHHLGGPSEIRDLGSVREVRDVLEQHLHVDTSGLPDLDTHLARLF